MNKWQTSHQRRIEQFMLGARQLVPSKPEIPSDEILELRAKLILEEALETIDALGFVVVTNDDWDFKVERICVPDLVKIADGCADLSVVTIGTLSACGIWDTPVLQAVDLNNLEKLEKGTLRADGKLVKPPGHKPPDLESVLKLQATLPPAPPESAASSPESSPQP